MAFIFSSIGDGMVTLRKLPRQLPTPWLWLLAWTGNTWKLYEVVSSIQDRMIWDPLGLTSLGGDSRQPTKPVVPCKVCLAEGHIVPQPHSQPATTFSGAIQNRWRRRRVGWCFWGSRLNSKSAHSVLSAGVQAYLHSFIWSCWILGRIFISHQNDPEGLAAKTVMKKLSRFELFSAHLTNPSLLVFAVPSAHIESETRRFLSQTRIRLPQMLGTARV